MDHHQHHMSAESHSDPSPEPHMEHMHSGHHGDFFNISDVISMGNVMPDPTMPRAGGHEDHMGHDGHNMMAHEGHNHGGENSHSMHSMHSMMSMTFHGGCKETILFSWWNVTEMGEFAGSFLAIFIMALLYEGLKYYRKHLLWKTYSGLQYCAVSSPDKGVTNVHTDEPQVVQPIPHVLERSVPTMLSTAHAWQTFLHGLQVLVSYMLMLVFMTYNTWLCAAVVLGSATGYFLFGWRESVVVDFTEHCH